MRVKSVLLRTAALPAVLMFGAASFAQTQAPASQAAPGQNAPAAQTAPSTQASPQANPSGGTAEAGRAARFDARIAQIKSVLRLTAEQEKHWQQAEAGLRIAMAHREDSAEQRRNRSSSAADFAERLRLRGEALSAHGAAMTRLAEAIKPLHDSLTADQKQRIASLMHEQMMARGDRGDRDGMMGRHERGSEGPRMGYGRYGGDRSPDWRGHGGDRGYQAWQRGNEDDFNLYDPNWRSRSYDYERGSRGQGWQGQGREQDWRGYGSRGDNQGWRRDRDNDGDRGYGNRDHGRYGRYGDDNRSGYGNRWREDDHRRGNYRGQYDNEQADDDHHDNED